MNSIQYNVIDMGKIYIYIYTVVNPRNGYKFGLVRPSSDKNEHGKIVLFT